MLKRIFSNVVKRVAVGLILAAVFAWIGTSRAHAGQFGCTGDVPRPCDQGQAYAACQVHISTPGTWNYGQPNLQCGVRPGNDGYRVCLGASFCRTDTNENYFSNANTCLSRDEQFTWSGPNLVCYQGCMYGKYGDPGNPEVPLGYYYSVVNTETGAGYGVCSSADAPEPLPDSDADGVPDVDDAFPNDPKESADSDGDGIGDNADFSPDDPADGSDTPGEEDGDDEGDNSASGGGTCDAAPTCSGDGIQCAQLWQAWKSRCEGTAHGTVVGDVQNCSAGITVTSPDPVANAQLLALRKIACTDAGGGTGNAPGDANGNGVADVLEGAGSPGEDTAEDPEPTRFGLGLDTDLLDKENIFGGGQCPTMPGFSIKGKSINPSEYTWWCDFLAVARLMIPLLAGWAALQILMGRYT